MQTCVSVIIVYLPVDHLWLDLTKPTIGHFGRSSLCIQDFGNIAIQIWRKGSMAQVSDVGFCQIRSHVFLVRFRCLVYVLLNNVHPLKSIWNFYFQGRFLKYYYERTTTWIVKFLCWKNLYILLLQLHGFHHVEIWVHFKKLTLVWMRMSEIKIWQFSF